MRPLLIIFFVSISFQTFSQRDSIIGRQKFNFYGFSEMNITPNWSTALYYDWDLGIGINCKELKLEVSFPTMCLFDSLNYFKPAYKIGIGLNFIGRKNYVLTLMCSYLNFHKKGHKELFDYGGNSILVPINFNLMIRWTKTINDKFKWYINSGLALYEFRRTAVMDSDHSTRILDAGFPDRADMKCFTFGFGISYKIYEK